MFAEETALLLKLSVFTNLFTLSGLRKGSRVPRRKERMFATTRERRMQKCDHADDKRRRSLGVGTTPPEHPERPDARSLFRC